MTKEEILEKIDQQLERAAQLRDGSIGHVKVYLGLDAWIELEDELYTRTVDDKTSYIFLYKDQTIKIHPTTLEKSSVHLCIQIPKYTEAWYRNMKRLAKDRAKTDNDFDRELYNMAYHYIIGKQEKEGWSTIDWGNKSENVDLEFV